LGAAVGIEMGEIHTRQFWRDKFILTQSRSGHREIKVWFSERKKLCALCESVLKFLCSLI
jgi:hypothetical protein